ncbi:MULTISPECIES: sensor histidine kinase [Spirosoma]|nr:MULTISPECIES: sensor histidine kinase [Spirosoma]
MNSESANAVFVAFVVGSIVLVIMALFSASFIIFHRRRRREVIRERKEMQEKYQRELLQSQLEIQNQTLQQIAEELHDHIGQLLTVAAMRLNQLEDDSIDAAVQQSVRQTRDVVSTIITDVRALAKTLDQNTVQRFGLLPSLSLELDRIQRTGRIQTRFIESGEVYPLGQQVDIVLLRMSQELLNNVLKHARARTVTVSVDYQPDRLTLTVADDGQGFSQDDVAARPINESGSGMSNLHRRAELLGGTLSVQSRLGAGTTVTVLLPRNYTR